MIGTSYSLKSKRDVVRLMITPDDDRPRNWLIAVLGHS